MNNLNYNTFNNNKVWYNHYRGYIIKSWINENNKIVYELRLPYNHPNYYLSQINKLTNKFK